MSTSVVLEMTIELARSQGLSVRLLDPLFDVDESQICCAWLRYAKGRYACACDSRFTLLN